MEGKKPGEIKIYRPDYHGPAGYFIPYFKDKYNSWCGLNELNEYIIFTEETSNWLLYQEPKKRKRVKMWLWYSEESGRCYLSQYMDQAAAFYCSPKMIKIPSTEIEIEVPEE
jgi:hypothetical protein